MKLRNYQAATIGGLFSWWKENGNAPTVCVLPTGGGKTICFADLIKQLREGWPSCRVLILAHTKELVGQAADKLLNHWPVAPVGIYAAGLNRRDTDNDIISASRDSIAGALNKFKPFDLVIIDEAHLINNKDEGRYRSIISHFQKENPNVAIVGFTATPYRTGVTGGYIYGAERLFKGVAHEVKMIELMQGGYLCPITAKAPEVLGVIDTSKVKTAGGDFSRSQLAEASVIPLLVNSAVNDWKTKAYDKGRRSSCFFAVSIAHAEMIKEAVDALGIECGLVTGETDDDERIDTLARFDSGELPALVNVAVLTTGWDSPRLDCIVLLRPTRSLVLYLQIIGRGLRLHETKVDTLVLDYGGNLERFGPIDRATPAEKKKGPPKTQVCEHCDSVISFYAFNCPDCDGHIKDLPRKECDRCGCECSPSTTKCPACGSLFLSHKGEAEPGAILSIEKDTRRHNIERITATPMTAKKTGRLYLAIWFWVNMERKFKKNLFLDWPGKVGNDSALFWDWLIGERLQNRPASIAQAAQVINKCPHLLAGVESVDIDHRSKYKDIIGINPKVDKWT